MTVLVVGGCVPEGEALGSGVTVLVGSGVDSSGVTVAVGRGPVGILGRGGGWRSSSGDSACTQTAASSAISRPADLRKFRISNGSSEAGVPDVAA